ncbi:GNAT family N-acetyltransferase [Catellatospora vulcania]|uniref:GNAT family N-acetyltransferase n=1 Tax=Catellatospora vulcania TaxID=1460450 RepID=UPI0012D44766|nr:GNAT family N-acetyltransferase [Catellatospora vulcania]
MRILTFPERQTPDALRAQVVALQAQAWPPTADGAADGAADADDISGSGTDGEDGEQRTGSGDWHDPALDPVTMLLVDDGGTLLASLDVLSKEIRHDGRGYRARGLSRVVTGTAHRGRGHGRQLVSHAREAIRLSGADLGIFTCDRALQGFYESAGWQLVTGAVLVGGTADDPFPSDLFDKVTMAGFFSPAARRHADSFTDARIALHPGLIDRLW